MLELMRIHSVLRGQGAPHSLQRRQGEIGFFSRVIIRLQQLICSVNSQFGTSYTPSKKKFCSYFSYSSL